ncbi:hypothetical protein SEA_SADLAD_77 [Microbacterium phage SadLad]|nr:hypothetical protein SEA_SADLAD_77 [Microbacterium phage SadLad]
MSEQTATHIIRLAQGNFPRRPWPLTLSGTAVIRGMGEGVEATLVGFAREGQQEIAVTAAEAFANPASVVGLEPVLSDRTGFYGWGFLVEALTEQSGEEVESDG